MPTKLVAFCYHCSQDFIDDLNPDSTTVPFHLNEKADFISKRAIGSGIDISRSLWVASNKPYIMESTGRQEFSPKMLENIPLQFIKVITV